MFHNKTNFDKTRDTKSYVKTDASYMACLIVTYIFFIYSIRGIQIINKKYILR